MNSPTLSGFFRWRPAAWLRVCGPDAAAFLQGQFTSDLRQPSPESAVYGLWLNAKGKVVADSFIVRDRDAEDVFWVGSYHCAAAVIRERLESHIIADDVMIEDETSGWAGLTLFPTETASEGPTLSAGFIASARQLTGPAGFLFSGRRRGDEHAEWVAPVAAVDAARRNLQAVPERPADEVLRRRIEAGIPAVPADIGPADLPNEGGLERDAISYQKGCYLGQEVMARLKSMGQVRRRLVRVTGPVHPTPALPAPLYVGTRQVGELRSAVSDGGAGMIGLAMVSRLHVPPQAALAFAADAAPVLRLLDAP